MHSALSLLRLIPAQTTETAKEAAEAVTEIVFTALERNVLIGTIALSWVVAGVFLHLWLKERGEFGKERTALTEQLGSLTKESNNARAGDVDRMVKEFAKISDELDSLYRETVAELKELRKDDQERSDKREETLRGFALKMADSLRDMKEHFQGIARGENK
jgi:hypothetical protein